MLIYIGYIEQQQYTNNILGKLLLMKKKVMSNEESDLPKC